MAAKKSGILSKITGGKGGPLGMLGGVDPMKLLMGADDGAADVSKKSQETPNQKITQVFAPGFPPFAMKGPYFHPPIKVTVNQVNTPDENDLLNPYEIELENLKKQNSSL